MHTVVGQHHNGTMMPQTNQKKVVGIEDVNDYVSQLAHIAVEY